MMNNGKITYSARLMHGAVESSKEGKRTAPIDAAREFPRLTKCGMERVWLMIVAESVMVVDICWERECDPEMCLPLASSPRRTRVAVSRPVAVWIDLDTESENDPRVFSGVGDPDAVSDRLPSP